MSLYSTLRASGAIGGSYGGGSGSQATDMFPSLTLEECVTALPVAISESAIENEMELNYENHILVEAVINESSSFEALNESVLTGFKDRVKKAYTRVREFIASIIAKLKQYSNMLTKTAAQLSAKYGEEVRKKDLKGFVFEGYAFADNLTDKIKVPKDASGITSLVDNVVAKGFGKGTAIDDLVKDTSDIKSNGSALGWATSDKDNSKRKDYESTIEALKKAESDKETFKDELYKNITGSSDIGKAKNIQESLFKLFRGGKTSKVDLKEGTNFKRGAVLDRMKRDDEIDETIKSYENLEVAVAKLQDKLVGAIEKLEDAEVSDTVSDEGKEKFNNIKSASIDAIKGVNTLYQVALGCITTVKGALTSTLKERNNQDKRLLVAMLHYKNPSAKNNSFEDEDLMDADYEL